MCRWGCFPYLAALMLNSEQSIMEFPPAHPYVDVNLFDHTKYLHTCNISALKKLYLITLSPVRELPRVLV